jgi:hypothetical protein
MASLGSLSLFSAGLMLVGLGIILNIASLVLRREAHADAVREYEKEARLKTESQSTK